MQAAHPSIAPSFDGHSTRESTAAYLVLAVCIFASASFFRRSLVLGARHALASHAFLGRDASENRKIAMPEKRTQRRAQRDKAQGKAPSTQAGEYVREEIHHVREGKHGARSPKQAIAIGLSKARRSGVSLPPPEAGKASESTRRKARSDSARGRRTASRRPSVRRSQATRAALRREGRSAATPSSLSRQGKSAAAGRSPGARSTAARKALRTKGPARRKAAAKKAARTRAAHAE
jgi:hypothetical protein